MTKTQIVIVTETLDPHTDYMVVKLNELGCEPIRLNTDEIPIHTSMNFRLNGTSWEGYIKILSSGRVINIGDVRSIWWRRPHDFAFPPEFSLQEKEFAKLEINHALSGLWEVMRNDCYWVSFPTDIRRAGYKPEQLSRAATLGFDVPRTLITTDPEEALAFYESCDQKVIFKVMADPFLAADKILPPLQKTIVNNLPTDIPAAPQRFKATFTTLIGDKELAMLQSVRYVNCQFQELIPKSVELRVIVIGNEVFAGEIHSQAHEKTKMDWRHYDVDIPYKKANLPASIASRCLEFVRSYGLSYSALDLIYTPDGRYVFLENNPNGQFLFVEMQVPELKMLDALAANLVRGASH